MNKWLYRWTGFNCKQFAHLATGDTSFPGRRDQRLWFVVHWLICKFCRRYLKDIETIGRMQKENSGLSDVMRQLPAIKQRLHQRFKAL